MTKKSKITVALIVIFAILTLLVVIFTGMQKRQYASALEVQSNEIISLETQLALAKANYEANQNQVVTEVSGVNVERKQADDVVAREFISRVTTWADVSEYRTMRAEIVSEYGLDQNSYFLQSFLPIRPQGANESAGSVNSEFSSMDSICISADEDTGLYSYFTEVVVHTAGAQGGIGEAHCVFLYTVSADGELSNIEAYTYA